MHTFKRIPGLETLWMRDMILPLIPLCWKEIPLPLLNWLQEGEELVKPPELLDQSKFTRPLSKEDAAYMDIVAAVRYAMLNNERRCRANIVSILFDLNSKKPFQEDKIMWGQDDKRDLIYQIYKSLKEEGIAAIRIRDCVDNPWCTRQIAKHVFETKDELKLINDYFTS